MAYIFILKQATKMGFSLLHSPLTATSSLCWVIQTLFQQSNHNGMLNLYRIANKRL